MRGTWQGSGTWKTNGPDFWGLVPVLAVVGVAGVVLAAVEWLLARIWWVIGGTVVLAVVAAAVFVALSRWTDRCEARFAAQRRAQLAGQAAAELPHPQRPVVEAAPRPQAAIENHVHYHLHVDGREAAPVIRTMLPGQAGDAVTEGE